MESFYHSADSNFSVVHCLECAEPMYSIYDPEIRDTCSECGGESKVIEDRNRSRAEYGLPPVRIGKHLGVDTLYGPSW